MNKAIFIAYNQAYYYEIVDMLEQKFGQRGFTMWENIQGRGGVDGEPHLGSHAWPTMNNAILTIVPASKAADILSELQTIDEATPALGLRAFSWSVD